MKAVTLTRLVLAALCLVAMPTILAAQAGSQVGSVEQQIRQLEGELSEAAKRGDTIVFERLLADDYTTTAMASGTRTKAQMIADVKSGVQKSDAVTLEDVKVRVYGDTAILTAKQVSKGKYKGADTSGVFHRLRVYVRQQGQWRAAAFQSTPVAKK